MQHEFVVMAKDPLQLSTNEISMLVEEHTSSEQVLRTLGQQKIKYAFEGPGGTDFVFPGMPR